MNMKREIELRGYDESTRVCLAWKTLVVVVLTSAGVGAVALPIVLMMLGH
jgi:hypothetical protein